MALVRWQPFRELNTIRQQMDRLFEDLMPTEPDFLLPGNGSIWKPAIEIQETEKDSILKAAIPGIKAKDLDIEVTQEEVAISGEYREEKQTEEKAFFRSEFHYGNFQRIVPLPVPIQNDRVKSEFKDGILTLTMPKLEDAPRKVVKVNITDA